MLNKTHKELRDFTSKIKTIKKQKELLNYCNSSFLNSTKLLISISSTFSIYWRLVLPFIISLSVLLALFLIEPIAKELRPIINPSYIFIILLFLVLSKIAYILNCKKFLVICIEESKDFFENSDEDKA